MKAYFDTGGSAHAYAHAQTHGHGDILADASSSVDKSFCLSDALFFVRIWLLLEQEKKGKSAGVSLLSPPSPPAMLPLVMVRGVLPCVGMSSRASVVDGLWFSSLVKVAWLAAHSS